MSTAAQRKAWNEAMRSAGAVLPSSISASSGGGSSRGAGGGVASRSRRKRRERAKRAGGAAGGGTGGASSLEEREYRVAVHMDILEGVKDDDGADGEDDDEYDEFADLDDDGEGGNRGKAKKRRKRGGGGGAAGNQSSGVPKYLKPRSLASILIEEASRPDSVAKQYVNARVRRLSAGLRTISRKEGPGNAPTITTTTNPYAHRKFCPVTGLFGEYTEPKSGIPYATLSALEQIRERHPPWMNAGSAGGGASYWEAIKSLQNNS